MTNQIMKYSHYKYIPHWFLLRLIVVSPLLLIYTVSKFVTEQLEKFFDVLDKVLPPAYVHQRLEFHELPEKRQKEIKKLNQKIMSQVQKVDT